MIDGTRRLLRSVYDASRRVATQPRDELTRWQRSLRFAYDLGRHGAKRLSQNRAPQMAAALAFRTLFGLLPVLVVATVVARALMGEEGFLDLAKRLIESARLDQVEFSLTVTDSPPSSDEIAAASGVSLGEWLQGLFAKAMNINLAAIGWIGLVVLIYSAIGLVVTVENSFNRICHAPEGRSWLMRALLYWFLLTVGPIAIGVTFWVDNRVDAWIGMVDAWHWLLVMAKVVWGFAILWLFMMIVYIMVPNTPVSYRTSAVGAFVAALALMIGTRLFGVYIENAVSFTQLYGSLGLIPLFMFWVYVMWLVVLFGLEVASTLHGLRGRRLDELKEQKPRSGIVESSSLLLVMEIATERFQQGRPLTVHDASVHSSIDEPLAKMILQRLADERLLHPVVHNDEAYVLAQPPEQISAAKVLQIGFEMADTDDREDRFGIIERLRNAQIEAASGLTLERFQHPPVAS